MSIEDPPDGNHTSNQFDIFQRTSEVDFLKIFDEEDEKEDERTLGILHEPLSKNNYGAFRSADIIYNNLSCETDFDEWRNRSEVEEAVSTIQVDDSRSISDTDSNTGYLVREITDVGELFEALELVNFEEDQINEKGEASDAEESGELESLLEFSDTEDQQEVVTFPEEEEELPLPPTPISELTMSQEARFAILETLHDLNSTKSKTNYTDIRFKGVTVQKRLRENRNKYNNYKTLTENGGNQGGSKKNPSSRYKSFDSGSGAGYDDYSSTFSSESNDKGCDDSSSDHEVKEQPKVQKLPSIGMKKQTLKSASSGTNVFSLEDAKVHRYRLPGIGKYDIMLEEKDFEITPPGFDSRYNPKPSISQDEREPPPRDIQEKSIRKCKRWLKNVSVFPMSLTPAQRHQ